MNVVAGKGRPIADLTGKRFGRLIVVGIGEKTSTVNSIGYVSVNVALKNQSQDQV